MANTPRDNFTVNPAVRSTEANKDFNLKNFQAKSRWSMLVKKIEKQKREREHEITEEQNKLLKYREKLQSTTLNLSSARKEEEVDEQNVKEEPPKKMTFLDVYRSLMEATRNNKEVVDLEDGISNNSPQDNVNSRGTVSSQQKRVVRKRFSYSLNDLQKANSSLQNKFEEKPQPTEEKEPDESIPTVRPRSLLDFTEDDEALGPLRLPPTSLPKIYEQRGFKPRTRSYDKDDRFKRHVSGSGTKIEDLRYCRYLRTSAGTKRRNTAPAFNFGQLHRNANKKL